MANVVSFGQRESGWYQGRLHLLSFRNPEKVNLRLLHQPLTFLCVNSLPIFPALWRRNAGKESSPLEVIREPQCGPYNLLREGWSTILWFSLSRMWKEASSGLYNVQGFVREQLPDLCPYRKRNMKLLHAPSTINHSWAMRLMVYGRKRTS